MNKNKLYTEYRDSLVVMACNFLAVPSFRKLFRVDFKLIPWFLRKCQHLSTVTTTTTGSDGYTVGFKFSAIGFFLCLYRETVSSEKIE